jgi:hypothetical protein
MKQYANSSESGVADYVYIPALHGICAYSVRLPLNCGYADGRSINEDSAFYSFSHRAEASNVVFDDAIQVPDPVSGSAIKTPLTFWLNSRVMWLNARHPAILHGPQG